MIDMALKNIWQRKARSLLTVLGVGLAVVLYVYLSTIMSFYDRDLERTVASFAGKVIVQSHTGEPSRFPPVDSLFSTSQANAVLDLPGVDQQRSSPVLLESIVANPAPNMPPSVMAVGITPGREFAFVGSAEIEGAGSLSRPDQVILGAGAAQHYSKQVNETLTINGHDFVVTGVISEQTEVVNNAILMPLETARDVFARSDVVSAVMVTAADPGRVADLADAIEAHDQQLSASTPSDLGNSANELLGPQRAFFATVRSTLVAVGVVLVTVVMVIAVSERRKEIGTFKALGATRRHIFSLVLGESVVLTLAGALGAILVAWLLTLGDAMGVDMRLALQTVLVALLVSVLATLWPAWSAHRVDPIESLRQE